MSFPLVSWTKRHRALRWPIIRGVVALAESLKIGFSALGISANAQLGEDEEEISSGMWVGTVVAALALAIGLFFVVPVGITSLFKDKLGSAFLFWLVEGVLRTSIFLGYLWLLSRLRDLRRVFEYHGAEHKVISCLRGRRAADAGEREVLAPAPALWHGLPADRDDRRHLHLRAARAAGLVLARRLAHPRRAADRRALLRGHQVGRAQPRASAGCAPSCGRACSCRSSRRASPTSPSSRSPSPSLEAVLAVEDPRAASAEDTVGMEVVA